MENSIINKLDEGIWVVKNIKDGTQIKKIHEKVDELPEAIKKAELEQYRYEITKALCNKFTIKDHNNMKCILGTEVTVNGYGEIVLPSASEMVKIMFDCVK